MTPVDIPALTAAETADLYRSGELSPVEAADGLLERIEALDPAVNAFCHLDPEVTLAQARAAEARFAGGEPSSPIDGIVVAVKDTFLTDGWPTLKGSRLVDRAQPWTDDAPAVALSR